ncbi:MAG: ATPase, T2SS/T4P/T4SS family [Rhodobacteraceae bacterium]|nr:ATPase, T2SS/T4P/T4SS family [Paracoccaceae bacterium]
MPIAEIAFDSAGEASLHPASMMPDEPITSRTVRTLLTAAIDAGVSDITLQTDEPPRLHCEGRLYRLGRRRWQPPDIESALTELYQATNGIVEIRSRKSLDFAYEIQRHDRQRSRFRVNATGIEAGGGYGLEIALRCLPNSTPTTTAINLSPTLIRAMTPRGGLVILAGPTGCGKSTTLAALVRHHFEKPEGCKIVDLQSPIEFTYRDLKGPGSIDTTLIGQSEIGKHLGDFAGGVRSALRRNPDIIIIGEARDAETITAALNAALTGHLVYTTTHANSPGECLARLLHGVPRRDYHRYAFDLASVLRLVMTQSLHTPAGQQHRRASRRHVIFDDALRTQLSHHDPWSWPAIINRAQVLCAHSQNPALCPASTGSRIPCHD